MNRKKVGIITGVIIYLGLSAAVCLGAFDKDVPQEKISETEEATEEEVVAVEDITYSTSDNSIDILSRYDLPSFVRMEETDREEYVNQLQIMKKIDSLHLDMEDFIYPEQSMEQVEQNIDSTFEQNKASAENGEIVFQGNTSKELQQIINENAGKTIRIEAPQITVSETIDLPDDTTIEGNHVKLVSDGAVKNAFFADSKKNISISGVVIEGGFDYGIYVIDSEMVTLDDCEISGLEQKPVVVVGNCRYIVVSNNTFKNNNAGGIYFDGDINYGIIENNDIISNYGTSNWMAGIVLTNVKMEDKNDIWETFDEQHHFPFKEDLYSQTECPHNIIVRNNVVKENNASGIYGDGAYLCYIVGNEVDTNDKEGICLDYGSFGCYLFDNTFEGNGRRFRQTDEDLSMDFVLEAGRMEDGSAKSKLPGVSLDNTAYNTLINNTVVNNYGGGIKMVRTTVRCLIIENIIKENNLGANDNFHFFGIELGSAPGDVDSTDMDFTADYENIICRNVISGEHYSGVFIGEGGYVNDVFDNVIMQPQMFSVECTSVMYNSIVNNISNKEIRNEYDNVSQ